MTQEDKKQITRRNYLKYVGAGIVVVGAAAAAAYYGTLPRSPPTPTETTTLASATTSEVTTAGTCAATLDTLLCDFETLGDWTLVRGEAIVADTTNFKGGTSSKGIKYTSADGHILYATKPSAFSAVDKHFTAWAYLDVKDNLDESHFKLDVAGSGWTKYFSIEMGLRQGWNKVLWSRASATAVGGAVDGAIGDWANITAMRVSLGSKAGTTVNLTLDDLHLIRDRFPGKITLRFDDGLTSAYTIARPRMDAYGFRGVSLAETGNVGKKDFMTTAQLTGLQDRGWDIISHSVTHPNLTTTTASEVEYQLAESQRWLIANGFVKGSRFFAPPKDATNAAVVAQIMENYVGCSTGKGYGAIPPPDPYYLCVTIWVDGTTPLANVQKVVDNARTYNAWSIIAFHDLTGMEALFQSIIDYIQASGLEVVTLSDVFDGTLEAGKLGSGYEPICSGG